MRIAPETKAVIDNEPLNIPPHGVSEADYPYTLDFLVAVRDRREAQLSEANAALVRLRNEYVDLEQRLGTTIWYKNRLLDQNNELIMMRNAMRGEAQEVRRLYDAQREQGLWKTILQKLLTR